MRSIIETHVARSDLAVVEVAALDDATAFAVVKRHAHGSRSSPRWASGSSNLVTARQP
ncbi:DUF6207 family protein [Streptomyces sp. IBSBF 2394]|uniref:DUF6207 family protein n=1 Tax=Streptomyces sp. IBSBF 2394 TaxID=2903532 RepID=UPI002FDBB458